MGNYEQLKQSVSDVIKTNGNQEITGSILQSTLLTIISTVGANATFAGIATPATNPGTPDGPVFYLASENGTYSNFGGIELQDGLSVLTWNGSWSSQQIFGIDDEPTVGSDNLVKSGSIILNKNYYRSILASNLGYYSGIINKFIKELWISPTVELDIDKLCIGNIRKRANSVQWSINFYNSQTPSDTTSYESFESIKKRDSLELIVGSHGSYCLVDWSAIDDGQVMGVINPVYCLDVNYVTDIDNFPIIKVFKEHGILNSDITDIKNLSNTGLLYVKQLTLNGLTSNDNLNLRIAAGSVINFQIYRGNTLLCWLSAGKTEYEDYYLITSSSLNNLPLNEYQSSGVTGTISLCTNKILKSDVDKRFPFTYPFGDDYPLLDAIRNALNNDNLKSRKNFWKLPLRKQSDLHKQVNLAIREIYLIKQNGSAIDENNIVLGDIRKNFGSGNDSGIAFFVGGENPPHKVLNFNSTSANATGVEIIKSTNNDFTGYVLVDWDAIPTSRVIASVDTKYLIDWNTVSNIANSPTLYSYLNLSKSHKEIVIEKLNTPDISWVDDDFQLDSVLRIKNLGLQLGFRSDFGLIPRATGGTGEYPTDFTFSFTSEQLAVIKEVENAGFHCEHHPVHRGWYSSESAGTYQGRQYIEYLLCSGMRLFKEDSILDSNCVIYPGGSGSNDEAVEMCRSHVKYGIAASGPDANVGSVDPMKLGRLFISTISQSLTKTYWKNKILNAFNTGGWIILGTHGHMFDNSGTVDETTPSFANLAEIIEYANTLSTIKPVSEVYRKRKLMLDLYKV